LSGDGGAEHSARQRNARGQAHETRPGGLCKLRLRAAHKTQRSGPGEAHDRRQYKKYGKVVQQRQVGFVGRA